MMFSYFLRLTVPLKICHYVNIIRGHELTFTSPTMQNFARIKCSRVLLSAVTACLRNYSLLLFGNGLLYSWKGHSMKIRFVLHVAWVKALVTSSLWQNDSMKQTSCGIDVKSFFFNVYSFCPWVSTVNNQMYHNKKWCNHQSG